MSWETGFLQFNDRAAGHDAAGNSLIGKLRKKSFEKFKLSGFPNHKDEAWKFTSLSEFKKMQWELHDEADGQLTHDQMQEVSKQLPSEFINFVFVNGRLDKTLSDDHEPFLRFADLTDIDFLFDELHAEDKILNLAQSFVEKKICLDIAKHKTVDRPIQFLFIQSSQKSVYSSEKLEIRLDENSEAKILINTISFSNAQPDAMNLNIKAMVGADARLTLIQLQNEDSGSFHFSQVDADLKKNAKILTLPLILGNKLCRNYLHINFTGEYAQAEAYGLSVLDGLQHADNYTFIQHSLGNNKSIQHYKSILSGASRSVFRGRVLIEPNAQKADSEQLNNNLMLTREATVDTVPQLEIFADDVKAAHGATVGQLNKDEIFYFLSRGINQYQAVKMLSYGFANEIIFKVENNDLQKYLINILNKKLESLVQNA